MNVRRFFAWVLVCLVPLISSRWIASVDSGSTPELGGTAGAAVPSAEITLNAGLGLVPTSDTHPQAFGTTDREVCVLALEGFRLRALHSKDGGATFDSEVDAAGPPATADVLGYRGALADDGSLYVALQVADPAGGRGLAVVRSDDLCRSWNEPHPVVAHGDPAHGLALGQLDLDTGSPGVVGVVFFRGGETFASASSDAGVSWTAPVAMGASSFLAQGSAAIEIDPRDDTLHVVYEAGDVRVRRSLDLGQSFEPPTTAFGSLGPFLRPFSSTALVAEDGSLLVSALVFDPFFRVASVAVVRSIDGGQTFVQAFYQFADSFLLSIFPRLTSADGSPTVLLSYVADGRLWVARSVDHGATFAAAASLTPQTALSDVAEGDRQHDVVGTALGSWAVVWADSRNLSVDRFADVFLRRSFDGGASWSVERRVNAAVRGPASSHSPRLAGSGGHALLVAFLDSRLTGGRASDLFASRIPGRPARFGHDRRIDGDVGLAPTAVAPGVAVAADGVDHVHTAFLTNADGGLHPDVWVATSADSGRNFGAPRRVSTTPPGTRRSDPPSVAATPDGHVYVFHTSGPATPPFAVGELRFNRSADFGATWLDEEIVIDGFSPVFGLQVAARPGGVLHVVAQVAGDTEILTSLDAGDTFSRTSLGIGFPPRLCVAGERIFLAWQSPFGQVLAAVSDDQASSFVPALLDPTDSRFFSLDLDCTESGAAIVAWIIDESGKPRTARYDGAAWQPPVTLDAPEGFLPAARVAYARPDTDIVVAYAVDGRIHANASTDGGASFGSFRGVSTSLAGARAEDTSLTLAADDLGAAWAVWVDRAFFGDVSILASPTTDGGSTWGTPRRLDSHEPVGVYPNFILFGLETPTAVLPGAVLATWSGFRTSRAPAALLNADDLTDPDRDGASPPPP